MDGEKKQEVQIDEVGELTKEVVVKKKSGLPPVRSTYDDFVEGVATREIAKSEGVEPGKDARVFQTEDSNGGKTVHLVGRSDIVSELGDTMERGGYRVREWHIRRPVEPGREAEKVLPALEELVKGIPAPILGKPEEFLGKALGLPLKALSPGEVADEAAKAIHDFKGGGQSG